MEKSTNIENEIAQKLSTETLEKIHIRVGDIRMYIGHFRKISKMLPKNEVDLVYNVYLVAISTLYRSIFKGLDKEFKIKLEDLSAVDDIELESIHKLLISLVDKDFAHIDKKSKSLVLLETSTADNVKMVKFKYTRVTLDQLEKASSFLSGKLEPLIRNILEQKIKG
jgi:hypothetical protein